jgi:hypothetical protein
MPGNVKSPGHSKACMMQPCLKHFKIMRIFKVHFENFVLQIKAWQRIIQINTLML